MAELLVYASNRVDQNRDDAYNLWQYNVGDIIAVKADGHMWGAGESMAQWRNLEPAEQDVVPRPPFVEVSVPGLSVDDALPLERGHYRPAVPGDDEYDPTDPDAVVKVYRRAFRLRFDRMSQGQRRDCGIQGNGFNPDFGDWTVTLSLSTFEPLMDHKVTRVTFDAAAVDGFGAVDDSDGEPNITGVPLLRRADRQ